MVLLSQPPLYSFPSSDRRWATLLMTSSVQVQCCMTSTETIRSIRGGEPRTTTSTFTQLLTSDAMFVQCCFTSTETTLRSIRGGEPRTSTSTFTQLLTSDAMFVQCCFTSTETTLRSIRGGEPRTSTSTFTQLLSSDLISQHTSPIRTGAAQYTDCPDVTRRAHSHFFA